jgi:glycosyltransferase involved in cell wall biosynthesis
MATASTEPVHCEPPTVTVVICAYTERRWQLLIKALAAVQGQSQEPDELILVIDHNPVVESRLRALVVPEWKVISNKFERGLSGARNSGVAIATSDIVAFLDDDAIPAPDWLEHLVVPFQDENTAGVGGWVEAAWVGRPPTWWPHTFNWVVGCSYTGLPRRRLTDPQPDRRLDGNSSRPHCLLWRLLYTARPRRDLAIGLRGNRVGAPNCVPASGPALRPRDTVACRPWRADGAWHAVVLHPSMRGRRRVQGTDNGSFIWRHCARIGTYVFARNDSRGDRLRAPRLPPHPIFRPSCRRDGSRCPGHRFRLRHCAAPVGVTAVSRVVDTSSRAPVGRRGREPYVTKTEPPRPVKERAQLVIYGLVQAGVDRTGAVKEDIGASKNRMARARDHGNLCLSFERRAGNQGRERYGYEEHVQVSNAVRVLAQRHRRSVWAWDGSKTHALSPMACAYAKTI